MKFTSTTSSETFAGDHFIRDIVIVDSRPDDFGSLLMSHVAPHAQFHFCTTAGAALKLSVADIALWLVNLGLPDMPGASLASDLLRHFPDRQIVLVADGYSVEAELTARVQLGLPFVCKPAQPEWLSLTASCCRAS